MLPEDMLIAPKCRAEEALAADGVPRTRLRYDVRVKLKLDALLDDDDYRGQLQGDGWR